MKQGTRHGAASRRHERNERAHIWPSTNGRSLQRPPVCGVVRWLLCLRFDGVRVRGAALLDAARLVPDTTHTARGAYHVLQWRFVRGQCVARGGLRGVRRVCGTPGQCVAVWRARGAFLACCTCGVCASVGRLTRAPHSAKICVLEHVQTFENTCNVRGVRGVQLVGLLACGVSVARSTLCGVLDDTAARCFLLPLFVTDGGGLLLYEIFFFAVSLACISDLQASANALAFVTSSPWLARSVASGRARLHVSRWPFAARFRRSPCPFQGWRRVCRTASRRQCVAARRVLVTRLLLRWWLRWLRQCSPLHPRRLSSRLSLQLSLPCGILRASLPYIVQAYKYKCLF